MRSLRLLQSSDDSPAAALPPQPLPDSNIVIILAAMLCAMICVIGLALVALCARLSRRSANSSTPPAIPSKGLNRKVLKSLPSFAFESRTESLDECAICLSDFLEGDEIRVLPECGHGFHVDCVDKWLGSHSSCPSCRGILVVPTPRQCQTCGGATAVEEGDGKVSEAAGPTS